MATKRRPASVGEILIEEFIKPLALTQGALAAAMGVPRKHVNELCNDRRAVTAPTALILARVFGNMPDFSSSMASFSSKTCAASTAPSSTIGVWRSARKSRCPMGN